MPSRLDTYRQAIKTTIKAAMPDLQTCEAVSSKFDLAELNRAAFRTPAIFIVLLRTPINRVPDGGLAANSHVAVFAVTDGREEERETSAYVMAEAVAQLTNVNQMWGLTRIGPVQELEVEQVHSSALDKKGVACIAITWRQRVNAIGEGLFDDEGQVATELYVNGELVDEINPEDGDE